MIAPGTVETLGLRLPFQHNDVTTHLFLSCFGAQAVLVGTILYVAELSPNAFLTFGLVGSIPFFLFDWYFYFVEPIFTGFILLDVFGNLGILFCGVQGYRLKKRELAHNTIA